MLDLAPGVTLANGSTIGSRQMTQKHSLPYHMATSIGYLVA